MSIHYSAPGKLFISGEWSILEVGNIGMVAAVNNRVHVEVDGLAGYDGISVTAKEFNISDARAKFLSGKIVFLNVDDKAKEMLKLLGEAISTALNFLNDNGIKFKPFKITTNSKETQIEVNGELKKVGFGSSAAVVVAAIAAVLDFFGYRANKEEVYKLSTIAHYFAQGKVGSAFDVAASAYGGLLVYSRFDPVWLINKMEKGERLLDIVKEKWPSLVIEPLNIPDDFQLLVGWTKESASTSAMIKQMNEFKAANRDLYNQLITDVASCARNVISAWQNNDWDMFFIELQNNEEALARLGANSGVHIETPELRTLAHIAADCGAAGKLSGAGGGDCGIAVCFDSNVAKSIVEMWKVSGLYPLDVTIDRNGVRREK